MRGSLLIVATVVLLGCGSENADVSSPTGLRLEAHCGSVSFDSVPPELDEFPPLDDDAQAALDELVNGPTGIEAVGFDVDYRWSIASRTDEELVLFGQGETTDAGSVTARFARQDDTWTPRSWGGCRVEIEADGYGPARLATESDQPLSADSTQLSLVINERDCASGEAPTDRDIVPVVTETSDAVSIVVLVETTRGDVECPGNPWHPIVITLGMIFLYRGIAIAMLRGQQINELPTSFGYLAIHPGSGFRGVIVLGVAVTGLLYLLLGHTRFGRHLYALGASESAARLVGISRTKIWLGAFALSGLLVGLAAAIELASSMQMQAQLARGWELQAIAIAVIGGVSITGGRGSVLGVFLGALLLQLVGSALVRWEIQGSQVDLVVGGMILVAVVLDQFWRKLER